MSPVGEYKTMASTTKTPEWHKNPISQGQARFIGQLIPGVFPKDFTAHSEGGGFGQWVPGWTEPEEGVYPSLHAATLLAELGITSGNGSEAISYLKRMKGRPDARLSTFGERLGLEFEGQESKPVQSSTSFDIQEAMARIAKLQEALEQQLAVANGEDVGGGEEDSGGAESSVEEEVEAEYEGGSVLPF